jgi:hypothetical protein
LPARITRVTQRGNASFVVVHFTRSFNRNPAFPDTSTKNCHGCAITNSVSARLCAVAKSISSACNQVPQSFRLLPSAALSEAAATFSAQRLLQNLAVREVQCNFRIATQRII